MELRNDTLAPLPAVIRRPAYDRGAVRAGIAHFSMGNFHRAHQAVYVDDCLARGEREWGILAIGLMDDPREREKAAAMPAQDNLYTLRECPPDGEAATRVIGSIVEYMHAPGDVGAVLRRLCDPAIRIASMTVTEGGYNIDEASGAFKLHHPPVAQDLQTPETPSTVFGIVVEALRLRRAAGVPAFTVLSCDNLRHNGAVAKLAFLSYARARDADLAAWMESNVSFPGCMVDRITPATLPEDAERLNAASGVDDRLPVFAEDFIQWVVEDDFPTGRPDLPAVGVTMARAVDAYEQVKLRMLNAAHNMLAFPGLCAGYRISHEAMRDPNVHALLDQFMRLDAAPLLASIAPPEMPLDTYRTTVLARFGNPAISDQLLRIASDGASKLPVFMQDTLRQSIAQGRPLHRLAFLIACFIRYLRAVDDAGERYELIEPHLTAADLVLAEQPGAAPLHVSAFKGWGLADSGPFSALFVQYREAIARDGVRKVMAELVRQGE